jgi:8-oxo-dGTP diphosphatase
MKRIQVAVGVIQRNGKFLIGQRLVKDSYFEKWEFPGGKLDNGEDPLSALKRELAEELNIIVHSAQPLIHIEHDYPDRSVSLHVFLVDEFSGEPIGAEGQALRWVKARECKEIDFLQANDPIVNAVSLPSQLFITDMRKFGVEHTLQVLNNIQCKSTSSNLDAYADFAIQVRECDASESQLTSYLQMLKNVCKEQFVFLNGSPELAEKIGFDGVHLNTHRAKEYSSRDHLPDFWVGVSCHDIQQLEHAQKIADFALLSPVNATKSHPEQQGMGWLEFQRKVKNVGLPCYALGGMSLNDANKARSFGAQGTAAISSVWQ